MQLVEEQEQSRYRWIMATLAWLILFGLGFNWLVFAPMMLKIMGELSITFDEAGLIIALVPMALVVLCFPSGLLADRVGFRKTVLMGVTIMSFFGLLRGFSVDFATLAITMFACGAGYALSYPAVTKVIGVWFPQNETALATGMVFSGMEVGMSAALVLTPVLLGWNVSWRVSFIIIGILTLIITFLWIVLAREAKESGSGVSYQGPLRITASSFKSSFEAVVNNKHIWLLALVAFFLLSSQIGFLGFFPTALELRGVDPIIAGIMASMVTWFMIPGSLVVPKASARINARKPFLWGESIAAGVALYFAGTTTGLSLWISIMAYGFLSGGMAALALWTVVDFAGPSYVATASGLFLVVGYSGAVIGPWLVGLLASTTGSFLLGIITCVALTVAIAVLAVNLPEPRRNTIRHL
jgi:cyanate permease